MSWYIEIKSDVDYSQHLASEAVASYLNTLPELQQSSSDIWQSNLAQFFTLGAHFHHNDGYTSQGSMPKSVNLIEIIGDYKGEPTVFFTLADQIAAHFGWQVFCDQA
jgi:hypothetical protein